MGEEKRRGGRGRGRWCKKWLFLREVHLFRGHKNPLREGVRRNLLISHENSTVIRGWTAYGKDTFLSPSLGFCSTSQDGSHFLNHLAVKRLCPRRQKLGGCVASAFVPGCPSWGQPGEARTGCLWLLSHTWSLPCPHGIGERWTVQPSSGVLGRWSRVGGGQTF